MHYPSHAQPMMSSAPAAQLVFFPATTQTPPHGMQEVPPQLLCMQGRCGGGVFSSGVMPSKRRAGGRPRGSVGPVRAALMRAIGEGLSGPLDVLAAHTGWPPERVRTAVKEMRRAGELAIPERMEQPGRPGQPPGCYGLREVVQPVNALAFAQQAWR